MEQVSTNRSHGGTQGVYTHQSAVTGTPMTFSVFVPDHAEGAKLPVLWYLSGLTCTHANVTEKGEFRAACARAGVIFIAPDTSPRGDNVPDDELYDFGKGAGFYVDATQAPWAAHYRMHDYVVRELPALVEANFPVTDARAISGHSMGGHGALVTALRNPGRYQSVSAFSPIVAPMRCPWGVKAFSALLGPDQNSWRAHDASELVLKARRKLPLLVDQGLDDKFLKDQLKPELLEEACRLADYPLVLRRHEGYDHSYFFISTFIGDHVAYHAEHLS